MPLELHRLASFFLDFVYEKPLERVALASAIVGLAAVGQSIIAMMGTEFAVPATLALALFPVGFFLAVLSPLLYFGVPLTRRFGMALFVLAGILSVGSALTRLAEVGGVTTHSWNSFSVS